LYGFDDLNRNNNRNNNSSVFTEPLNSFRFSNNAIGGVPVGNNAKRMRFQIKGLDNVNLVKMHIFVWKVYMFQYYMMEMMTENQ
jgi:hypothetical protein